MRAHDKYPAGDGDRRQRGAAAVEDDQVRVQAGGHARPLMHVRDRDRTGEPAAAAATADRLDTCERRGLEVVGRRMASGTRQLDERVHRRRHVHDFRLGRPSPPHRDDDDVPIGRQQARDVPGHRCLPHPLPRTHDGERGNVHGRERRSVEAEIGPLVRQPVDEDAAGERHPLDRPEHRVVRQVEHELGRVRGDRLVDPAGERHAVVLAAAQLLAAADEHCRDDVVRHRGQRVPHDGRVVLTVDQRDDARHPRVVTSRSILPVYFSYSNVEVENWMIRSCPWNGWRRQIETCWPANSTTL